MKYVKVAVALVVLWALAIWLLPRSKTVRPSQKLVSNIDKTTDNSCSAQARIPPPKLVEMRKDVRLDPRSPMYSAAHAQNTGMRVFQIYEEELRKEPWATKMEAGIKSVAEKLIKQLVPQLTDFDVTCKAVTCRMTYQGITTREDSIRVFTVLRQLYPGSGTTSPKESEFIVILDGELERGVPMPRDADALLAGLEQRRKDLLTDATNGTLGSFTDRFGVTTEEWRKMLASTQ